MKNFKKMLIGILLLGISFVGCKNFESENVQFGSLTIKNCENSSRAVYSSEITKAIVTVSGSSMSDISKEVDVIGGKGDFNIDSIPVGKNRIISVQAFDEFSKIDGLKIYSVCDINPGENTLEEINQNTSKKGVVYNSLLKSGINISSLQTEEIKNIENSIPDVNFSLINSEQIASDFKKGSLKSAENYIYEYSSASISVKGFSGCTVQISDPSSKIKTVSSKSENILIDDIAPGAWNIYILDGENVVYKKSAIFSSGTVENFEVFNGIKVLVEKSLNFPLIHYWNCSDSISYTNTKWPGVQMNESGEDYYFEFIGVSSVNILITNSSENKLCSNDIVLSEKGIYRITSSGAEQEKEPEPPVAIVPSSANLGRTFRINVLSDYDLIENSVTISGIERVLQIGENVFNVSDFTSNPGNLSVVVNISNKIGRFQNQFTIEVTEKPVNNLVSNPNELRIYQVMVASFQDGDPSRGYTQMWGPDNQTKGGDLQGIINAIPYIKDLGCNALWMTPIFESGTGNEKLDATGYFAMDYFNIDDQFGTMEKFNELVNLCHENDIAVILDGVFGHNKGNVTPSPTRDGIKYPGITPDTNNPVNYATNSNSLKYYSDVASYWITEHKIDGWRLDQCYQVAFGENAKGTVSDNCNTGGHNYWYDIRKVVESAASSNGEKGSDWGTLGYMVGEHWRGDASTIQNGTVKAGNSKGYGLNSCFDFPAYYKLVQGFAQEWDGKSTENIGESLKYTYQTYSEKGYSCLDDDGKYDTYYPNLMLTNHDLYRIGDLINRKHNDGFESDNYIKRNQVLLAAQCAYTGPITIYYGDEIGDHNATTTSGWSGDNVSRSSGKITGFNSREQKIHDYTSKILKIRSENEPLWNGVNNELKKSSNFYAAEKSADGKTVYVAFNYSTFSSESFTISGSGTDLISGKTFDSTVTVPPLSAMYILKN